MEPEPPPITIVDPRSGEAGDVLAAGPEDRRAPTPRQRRTLMAAGLVAVLVGTVVIAVDQLGADRAADRAAVDAVKLTADSASQPSGPPDVGLLALRNEGPDPVRLLSAQLTGTGYARVRLGGRLEPGTSTGVPFRDTAPCGPALLTAPADAVTVQLVTARGATITREVPLSPQAFVAVNRPPRTRCGYLAADESLGFFVSTAKAVGDEVEVRGRVINDSVLAMSLLRLLPAPGLTLHTSPAPPFALPPQVSPARHDRGVAVTLRLRVHDCSTYLAGLRQSRRGLRDSFLRGWVLQESSGFEVPLPLPLPEEQLLREPAAYDVLDLLLRPCAGSE